MSSSSDSVTSLRAHCSHFWVSSSPFFATTLLFEPLQAPVQVRLFDADGDQFNEITVQFEKGLPGLLDLEPCMAACKFESGLKHARVEVASTNPISVLARLHTRDWAGVCREALPCNSARKFMVPFFCQSERTSVIAMLNRSNEALEVRARLFIANRSPEMVWKLPPRGARFVDTKLEFAEVLDQCPEGGQGYVRLSVIGDQEVLIQAFEVGGSTKQPRYFSFVT